MDGQGGSGGESTDCRGLRRPQENRGAAAIDYFTFHLHAAWLLISLLVLQLIGAEIGFRIGLRHRHSSDETLRSQVGVLEASLLGILGLLLGFGFSMAASRFDARRQQVLDEANAIGTTCLRTSLLPEPQQTEAKRALREYVDARVEFYEAGTDNLRISQARRESERLQQQLWRLATQVARDDPRAVTTGLFIQSLNQVIDLHSIRIAALYNRVPLPIFLLLYFVAIVTMGLTGYAAGTGGRRLPFPTVTAAILIACVIVLVIDLHRPREGLIRLGQQSMLDLRDSLRQSGE